MNQLNKKLLFEWKSLTNKKKIGVAAANRQQVVIASGTEVNYFEIMEGEIVPLGSTNLDFQVSCLDITPFSNFERTDYVALGLWTDMSIKIVRVPDFKELHYEKLGGGIKFFENLKINLKKMAHFRYFRHVFTVNFDEHI